MSTLLQEKLAEAIVENRLKPRDKRKNKKELGVSVGYATKTMETKPSEILEAKGVKDALRGFGLTEELITISLVDDIKAKPKKREKELRLGAEILGMKDEAKEVMTPPQTVIIIQTPNGDTRIGIQTKS